MSLADLRMVLARLAAERAKREQQQSESGVSLTPDLLADAFATALGRFTTEDGSLKVAQQNGSSMIGGG